MLTIIRKSKWTKIFAMFVLVSFLTEIMQPKQLFAIGGGPSQPEMAGITPVDTDQLVDLFSGDFHYTILIMTVPGPNGGFPINLNYYSGVGMEQEATWVGLGWNLNPGAINRQVRGIPDDFRNDTIKKYYCRRDNNTFLFSPGTGGEVYGADFGIGLNTSQSYIYNTYKGISLSSRFGITSSYVRNNDIQGKTSREGGGTMGYGINLDSDNGITQSFSMNGGNKNLKTGFNFGYNSKSGTYTFSNQISGNFSKNIPTHSNRPNYTDKPNRRSIDVGWGGSVGSSFSTAANLPPIHLPLSSTSWGLSFQMGGAAAYIEGFLSVNSNIVSQVTPDDSIPYSSCGLLYADGADSSSLQDFNREKELCVDKHSQNLPLPIMTNDIYAITGELMSGSFRAFRSDYGHFYDNQVKNSTFTCDAGVDLAFGEGLQIGANLSFTSGKSFSGDWPSSDYDTLMSFKDKQKYFLQDSQTIHPSLFEPFYFKMLGEQTASDVGMLDLVGGNNASSFPIQHNFKYTVGGIDYSYFIPDSCWIPQHQQANRTRRTYVVEYKTNGEGIGRKDNHISQFSILNADGERFTYGKTLYNYLEKEISFSLLTKSDMIDSTIIKGFDVAWAQQSTPKNNRVGKEKLFSCTKTPAYPYSYLLTSITSPDYIDLTGDGPSDDDYGYWVKLDYDVTSSGDSSYCWRVPYEGANYHMGDRSNMNDDLGSFYFGKKEIAYVDTIGTKTHYAVFYKSKRDDAYSANPDSEERGGYGENSCALYKLDSIKLFSREDPSVPIKTAVFEYDYSLCKGVPNNSNIGQGKLTLKKLYFKYANSIKGEQAPYIFHYSDCNPDYAPTKMDRWGSYKGDANYFEHYVTQNADSANLWASAWLLTRIDLPEGGSIVIEYESDDYAYVQDKRAMYMAEVDTSTTFEKKDGHYYIFFKKKAGTNAADYISGFKNNLMYFKIAVKYKASMVPDYIQGYAKVLSAVNVSAGIGRLEVEPYPAYDIHPVYFFALQYLKNNRPDLMFNGADEAENSSDAASFFRALVSKGIIDKANAMFGNNAFYRFCNKSKDYQYIKIGEPGMPSYVRLNVPDKIKYGGGSRVRSITMLDNWDKSDSSFYRQEYFYRKTENGKLISSGVAEYEPTVGAEENAMRYPVYDTENDLFFIEDEMYSEEPYGESYFPAANVGYSQVIVRRYTPPGVTLSTAGIQRYEFYTAKDFPIIVSQTDLDINVEPVPNVLNIITAGFKQSSSSCFSQGYLIELNDMHGKQKSISTCPYMVSVSEESLIAAVEKSGYTSKVEYFFHTQDHSSDPRIENCVDVLTEDGKTKKMRLGETFDFVVDQRYNHSQSYGGGVSTQFMLGAYYPPLIGVSAMPSVDCFEEDVKSVATSKIIYRTGVLKETRAYNNGSVVTTTNLQYDPYTGKPLLTKVTNEFEQPVYNYTMPAYWYYTNMGSAADNYRATYYGNTLLPNNTKVFSKYDKIYYNENSCNIDTIISNNAVRCWIPSGQIIQPIQGNEIIMSRNSNQLNTIAANITSLVNPTNLGSRRLPIIEQINEKDNNCFRFVKCSGDSAQWVKILYDSPYGNLYFFVRKDYDDKFCGQNLSSLLNDTSVRHLCFHVPLELGHSISDYTFSQEGRTVTISRGNDYSRDFEWNDPEGLFDECLGGVLQASATEFKSNWQHDYQDAGTILACNENYLGIPNIYRNLRSNLYVVDRKQSGLHDQYITNIAQDGVFSSFSLFRHGIGNAENMQKPWTWTEEITNYSPFNFEIENKNALGIYSAALYGYKNSLVTAVANNARYNEIAFDGFENDDPSTSIGSQRGHLKLLNNSDVISISYAHSGKKSLQTNALQIDLGNDSKLVLQDGEKYILSCWVRKNTCNTLDNLGESYVLMYSGSTTLVKKEPKVECWQRIEVEFTYDESANLLEIKHGQNEDFYVDDIRIQPYNSTFKSYVYNPNNYRLIAELDENNYATFYNYDEEGILVQIKKETERGIMTVQTSRQNLKTKRTTP